MSAGPASETASSASCREAVSKWYQLWTRWVRGLSDRTALLGEWKRTVVGAEIAADGYSGENDGDGHSPPFVWIDGDGRVWKGLDYLFRDDDIGDDNAPPSRDDETTTPGDASADRTTAPSYGSGASWGALEVSLDGWHVDPIDPPFRPGGTTTTNADRDDDGGGALPKTVRHYRVTCRVTSSVSTEPDGATVRTSRRRVSAVVRQTRSAVDDYDDDGRATFSSRLVQLQETPIPDDDGPQRAGTARSRGETPDEEMHDDGPTLDATDGRGGGGRCGPRGDGGAGGSAGTKSVPSARRFLAAQSVLDKFGAKPLLEKTESRDGSGGVNNTLVGLSIQGWDVATSQGPIGDQRWFEHALHELEPLAQYTAPQSSSRAGDAKGRRLVLPEMVFPLAHVVLERSAELDDDDDDGPPTDGGSHLQNHDAFLSWDAMEALKEWSRAHQAIPMPGDDGRNDDSAGKSTAVPSSVSFRGVSVLQSSDAALWKQKRQQGDPMHIDDDGSGGSGDDARQMVGRIRNSEFHYDWTYSTPFSGRMFLSPARSWEPLPQSAMPMYLLTDTSVPILYYDHILLLEDDLHDNGAVEYTVKVRIMPHCAYVLARLFVRVDNVLVRVRDARWLVDFGTATSAGGGGDAAATGTRRRKMIYRDITWREAAWKDLGPRYGLPSQIQAWTTTPATAETQAFQTLLSKLPLVDEKHMPGDVVPHSQLCYS